MVTVVSKNANCVVCDLKGENLAPSPCSTPRHSGNTAAFLLRPLRTPPHSQPTGATQAPVQPSPKHRGSKTVVPEWTPWAPLMQTSWPSKL